MRQTCIFSGSSHPALVEAICERLGQKPSSAALKKFSNGETSVEIKTSVRNQDVFIVQSGSGEINDNVVELLIMISACKGGSARSITAVVPYFPYSRQSKQKTHRSAITARMLANLMKVAGISHVITIDLHASQMQGFFKCPVDNLRAEPLIVRWIRMNVPDWREAVAVSKNPGGTKRVTSLADALQISFGVVTTDRRRSHYPSMNNSAIFDRIGERVGTDGLSELEPLEEEEEVAVAQVIGSERATVYQDFANGGDRHDNESLSRQTTGPRTTINTSANISSPGAGRTNHAVQSPGLHRDEDGYEVSEGEDEEDESALDVITGRLVHGHIVDDDAPSPGMSVRSASIHENGGASSEGDPPDVMAQSFLSTTSERFRASHHGLGGTGDATASDEDEEEALQNPQFETLVTLVGNVRNKPVFIVDDMIDKAGSWIAAAETVVKRGGATKVYCMATHGLFGGDSLRELNDCDEIEAIIVTDAFPIPEEKKRGVTKLVELDVSGLLSEAIRRNHHGESISKLYQQLDYT